MYSVMNQCCPNHCLATCSFTVVTPTQVVPLVVFTVQFFLSHAWATHSASRSLSLSPTLRVHRQSVVCISSATTFTFLSKVFHIGFICETTLTGESRFHLSTPLGIEPGSTMTGSKWVDHWTCGTVYECSEIAGSPQYFI